MNIGIPRERRSSEFRVGLTPNGVKLLTSMGHTCFVEKGAGASCGFSDDSYEAAGASIVYRGEEAYGRADLVLKIARPTLQELDWLTPGQCLCGLLHLGAAHPREIETMREKRISALSYEAIQTGDDSYPVLKPLSQIGGRMAAQVAARLLQNDAGGRGVLLGGVPGVPPAEVVIIGAGVVGENAARTFSGMGARLTLLDIDLERLQEVETRLPERPVMALANAQSISDACRRADVVVGAVRRPGGKPPIVLTREHMRSMRPGTIFMDLSIDEGGCAETSRPTTHADPVFVEERVVHCCIPNLPGAVARTSTLAFESAAWPYIERIAQVGLQRALETTPALERALMIHEGQLVNLRAVEYDGERSDG